MKNKIILLVFVSLNSFLVGGKNDFIALKYKSQGFKYSMNNLDRVYINDFIDDQNTSYYLCRYGKLNFGKKKTQLKVKSSLVDNFEKEMRYSINFMDTVVLHPTFLGLKQKALKILKGSYSEEILSKNIIFNSEQSCFYKVSDLQTFIYEEPLHNTGKRLHLYNEKTDELGFVDLAFDIQIENKRFSCISLRLDPNGTLINKPIKLWKGNTNTSIGLCQSRIKKLYTPKEAEELARKNSKWPIEGDVSVDLDWVPESDSLGKLIYLINYDCLRRGDKTSCRQIQINATNGEFIQEIEKIDFTFTFGDGPKKFQENGKWGFTNHGKVIIPAVYDELPKYCSNYLIAKKDGKFGLINKRNEVLIDFIYDRIEYFESSMERHDKWYLILTQGEYKGLYELEKGIIIPVQCQNFVENEAEQIIANCTEGKKIVFDLRTGKIL
jgi:hypothetical protein